VWIFVALTSDSDSNADEKDATPGVQRRGQDW